MTTNPFADFDEEIYLAANPDIQEAIAAGIVSSGFAHYRRFGRHELRAGTPWRPSYQPLSAMPPEALRVRVSGISDAQGFDLGGRSICDDILDTTVMYQAGLTRDSRVLDFGCGCGRVLRHFAPQCPALINGVDIDMEGIAWCSANLGMAATFSQTQEWPPLPFGAGSFDLIYSISVFTHLPEKMQDAWLAELRRVAKPGALLLLTVHAPNMIPGGNAEAEKQMTEHGFLHILNDITDGLPDFYRTAFHSEQYIRSEWGKLLHIEAFVPKGMNDHQDLVVARIR